VTDHREALSTGTNHQRTETIVDLSNITTGERMDTSPPTHEGLNLLPTYDASCNLPSTSGQNQSVGSTVTMEVNESETPPPTYEGLNLLPIYHDDCNLPFMAAEIQSGGTTLTSQIRSTSSETYSNLFGPFVVPNDLTQSKYWVSPSSSSQPTVQDSRTSANNGVSNSGDCRLFGVLTIGEGERPQHVPKKEGCPKITGGFYLFAFILVVLFVALLFAYFIVEYVPDKYTLLSFVMLDIFVCYLKIFCIVCGSHGDNEAIIASNYRFRQNANFV